MMPKIAPSILAADFAHLGAAIKAVAQGGADWIHVDVMDGHFVPNISIGVPVVRSIRPVTALPLDVHLMISEPDRYLEAFKEAGADHLTVHVEVTGVETLRRIREMGCRAGISLNPDTPLDSIRDLIPEADIVLVMSVHPGFGGQQFIEGTFERIKALRKLVSANNPDAEIVVDGGVGPANAARCAEAGATVLVAGSSVFRAPEGPADAVNALRRSP